MSEQLPAYHCGDAMDCCERAEYPTCQQNVEALTSTPCHWDDDQPANTPYLCTD